MIPTSFDQIIGNRDIKESLECMIRKRAIGNSLLFVGLEGIGKSLFARVLAAKVITMDDPNPMHEEKIKAGLHPDIHVFRPEGKVGMHSIQSIREFIDQVNLPPHEAKWKVFIIQDAERMHQYSANALLKTFEEPPPRTMIILLSRTKSAILPTIISRCRVISFKPLLDNDVEQFISLKYPEKESNAKELAKLAHGSIGRAIHLVETGDNEIRHLVCHLLNGLQELNSKQHMESIQKIAHLVDSSRKEVEEAFKQEFAHIPADTITAYQQQSIEKEIEGLSVMRFFQDTDEVFSIVFSWFRDLHLLLNGGDLKFLMNADYQYQLENRLQRGQVPSLERIQKIIDEAKLALQRSVSLHICLENLLLKLELEHI